MANQQPPYDEERVPRDPPEQPASGGGPARPTGGTGLQPNVAGLLCYLLTWITGIVFLVLEKEDRFVRFHAMQSIWVGVAWTVAWVAVGILASIPFIGVLFAVLGYVVLGVGGFILWVLLMVRAYQGQAWRLPVIGDAAARAVGQ